MLNIDFADNSKRIARLFCTLPTFCSAHNWRWCRLYVHNFIVFCCFCLSSVTFSCRPNKRRQYVFSVALNTWTNNLYFCAKCMSLFFSRSCIVKRKDLNFTRFVNIGYHSSIFNVPVTQIMLPVAWFSRLPLTSYCFHMNILIFMDSQYLRHIFHSRHRMQM